MKQNTLDELCSMLYNRPLPLYNRARPERSISRRRTIGRIPFFQPKGPLTRETLRPELKQNVLAYPRHPQVETDHFILESSYEWILIAVKTPETVYGYSYHWGVHGIKKKEVRGNLLERAVSSTLLADLAEERYIVV